MPDVIDFASRRRGPRPLPRTVVARANRQAYRIACAEAERRYHLLRDALLADLVERVVRADEIEAWRPRPDPGA